MWKLDEKVAELEKEKSKEQRKSQELTKIKVGDKVLHTASLSYTDPTTKVVSETFSLLYELEVIEVAESKLKVKGVDFTSNDKFARDPGNKASLISYINNKWIDKKEAQVLINSKQASRDEKLEKLFSKSDK
jgi:preprotein translocase subunit SecA